MPIARRHTAQGADSLALRDMKLRALACSTLLFSAGELSATVPSGFEDRFVIDVPVPTALAQLPDGRLLVTSQDGRLWLVQAGDSPSKSVALNLSSRVCDDSEQGLLGVDVDPDFAVNGRIYLYYTFRNQGGCPGQDPESPVNRVGRFRLQGSTVDPSSEVVLLDNIPSFNGNHNGGDVLVGKDGMLYVSVGDGGCDFRGDSGCAGGNDAARDRNTLLGKILRHHPRRPGAGRQSLPRRQLGALQPGQRQRRHDLPRDLGLGPAQSVPHRRRPRLS